MRNLKRLLLISVLLMLMLSVLVFVLENQQFVTLSFFGWSASEVPLSVFIILSLLAGMVVGPLLGVVARSRRSK